MPREAAVALAARGVVDERDPAAVVELRHHLVAEDDARVGGVELLDVRPAEPARGDPRHVSRTRRAPATSESLASPSGPTTTARTDVS